MRGSFRWDSFRACQFKYLWYVLDKAGTDGAKCSRNLKSGRVAGAIKSLDNARDLQLECASLASNIACPCSYVWSETMLWKEEERSRVRAVQMDNLRGLLGIRRMDRVLNVRIRELCGLRKGLERIDEGMLQWFAHVERMEKGMIAKRVL